MRLVAATHTGQAIPGPMTSRTNGPRLAAMTTAATVTTRDMADTTVRRIRRDGGHGGFGRAAPRRDAAGSAVAAATFIASDPTPDPAELSSRTRPQHLRFTG